MPSVGSGTSVPDSTSRKITCCHGSGDQGFRHWLGLCSMQCPYPAEGYFVKNTHPTTNRKARKGMHRLLSCCSLRLWKFYPRSYFKNATRSWVFSVACKVHTQSRFTFGIFLVQLLVLESGRKPLCPSCMCLDFRPKNKLPPKNLPPGYPIMNKVKRFDKRTCCQSRFRRFRGVVDAVYPAQATG